MTVRHDCIWSACTRQCRFFVCVHFLCMCIVAVACILHSVRSCNATRKKTTNRGNIWCDAVTLRDVSWSVNQKRTILLLQSSIIIVDILSDLHRILIRLRIIQVLRGNLGETQGTLFCWFGNLWKTQWNAVFALEPFENVRQTHVLRCNSLERIESNVFEWEPIENARKT